MPPEKVFQKLDSISKSGLDIKDRLRSLIQEHVTYNRYNEYFYFNTIKEERRPVLAELRSEFECIFRGVDIFVRDYLGKEDYTRFLGLKNKIDDLLTFKYERMTDHQYSEFLAKNDEYFDRFVAIVAGTKSHIESLSLKTKEALKTGNPIPSDKKYLEVGDKVDPFYGELIRQLNVAFYYELYVCVEILCRKIIENLLIDTLRDHYGKTDIDKYFDRGKGHFHNLSVLIKNLNDNLQVFKPYSSALDPNFILKLNQFKEHGNASAHTIELDVNEIKNRVITLKDALKFILEVFIRMR